MRRRKYFACMAMLLAAALLAAPSMSKKTDRIPANEERSVISEATEEIQPMPPKVRRDGLRKQLRREETAPAPEAEQLPAPEVWREDVPLSAELQEVLLDACAEAGIDPLLMLGLIWTESRFEVDAVSGTGDYGLCQLNRLYFDPNMTPEENLRAGVALLGLHLERYGNIYAALTAYHVGHDDGSRGYAATVISAAADWGYQNG